MISLLIVINDIQYYNGIVNEVKETNKLICTIEIVSKNLPKMFYFFSCKLIL